MMLNANNNRSDNIDVYQANNSSNIGKSSTGDGRSNGGRDYNNDHDSHCNDSYHTENKHENNDDDDAEKNQKKQDIKLNVNAPNFIPKGGSFAIKKSGKFVLDTIDEKEEEESKFDGMPIKCAGTIEIPRNLTQNIIPSRIKENISNIYYFMDKSIALRSNMKMLKNERFVVINYDFHDMDTDEILYCIIQKQDPSKHRGFSWIMMDRLFTKKEIVIEFNVCENELILPLSSRFESNIIQQIDYIHSVCDILQTPLIGSIVERTQWHRIPIYNKKNNKKRKVLYLTKKEFKNKIEHFAKNVKHITIIPIMMLESRNKDNCTCIQYIYIIKIDENVHIGLSMKYKPRSNRIEVTGIHLNKQYILNKHQLAAPNHDCKCLDHFESDIDDLKIGNIHQYKDLQKRYDIIKNDNSKLKKKCVELKAFVERFASQKMPISQLLAEAKRHLDNDDDNQLSPIPMVETQFIGTNTNVFSIFAYIPCVPSYPIPITSIYPIQPAVPIYNSMVQQQITSPAQHIIYNVQDGKSNEIYQ